MSTKHKRILIRDFGMYVGMAELLREYYEKVYLYVPWKASFPTSAKAMIGSGIDGVERIMDFWRYVDKADLIAFWDIYDADVQHFLRKNSYRVYGAGDSEELEVDRWKFKQVLHEAGLPVIPTARIIGIEKFKAYMKDKKEKYIKFSCFRGDAETHKWDSYEMERNWLSGIDHRMGDRTELAEFLIEDKVESNCEPGYDGFCIDGQWTPYGGVGYEDKDEGIIEKVFRNEDIPAIVKVCNDKLSPYFKKTGYRGNYSTEIRIAKDGTPYYADATTRLPSPPSEVMIDLFRDDYAQMIWDIAEGKVPTMKPDAKYGCQVMLHSQWYQKEWTSVSYPKEIEQYVKLRNKCVIKGVINCIPQDDVSTIGAVTAIGNTIDEAVKLCKERAEQVKGEGIHFSESTFDKIKDYIKEGNKFGISFA